MNFLPKISYFDQKTGFDIKFSTEYRFLCIWCIVREVGHYPSEIACQGNNFLKNLFLHKLWRKQIFGGHFAQLSPPPKK